MLLITVLITYRNPEKGTTEIEFASIHSEFSEYQWDIETLLSNTLNEIAIATNGDYQIISVSHTITNQLEIK